MNKLATTVVSRRKQQKPARVIEKMSINNECANSSSSMIRVDDLHSDQQPEVNLRAGTILGPFTMCNLTDNDDFVKDTVVSIQYFYCSYMEMDTVQLCAVE